MEEQNIRTACTATCGCGWSARCYTFEEIGPKVLIPAMQHAISTGHSVELQGRIRVPKRTNARGTGVPAGRINGTGTSAI